MPPLWSAYDFRRAARSCRGGWRRAVRRATRAVLLDVLDPLNLYATLQKMRGQNGLAPGIDQVGYDDLSQSELMQLFRDMRASVLDGSYCPQPPRLVEIAKSGGGKRTLRLAVIADRVLEKALADALTPLAERLFLNCSYGFRHGRDRFWMLAALKVACEAHGLWVTTADDVRKAFDHVPVAAAVAALNRLGVNPTLVALAEIILKGHEQREVGIAQGGALSPLILNLLLHFALDITMAAARGGREPVPYYRYADNLVVATRTAQEGRELLERIRHLLSETGLSLKGAPGVPCDLAAGEHLELLGVRLTRTGDRLTFEVPNHKWGDRGKEGEQPDTLRSKLKDAHRDANPTAAARQLVTGWVQALAPTFGSNPTKDEETTNRLVSLLHQSGHRHALTRDEITRTMRSASSRWERMVSEARDRMTTTPTPTTGTTPYTTSVTSDVEHAGTDRDNHDTVMTPTAYTTANGTSATGSGTSPQYSTSSSDHRPSSRSTALPDRSSVPPSAPRRVRTASSTSTQPRPRPHLRPAGGSPGAARPPPRRP